MKEKNDLSGKNLLIFSPNGRKNRYGDEIVMKLENMGAIVKIYPERPSTSTISKVFLRIFKNYFPRYFINYLKSIINKHKEINFDYILVIRGEAFSKKALKLFKKNYPKAYTILYLWDILAVNDIRPVFNYFDKVLSFDSGDVSRNEGLFFRPLFYLDRHKEIKHKEVRQIDICFAGTIHSVRYRKFKNIEKTYRNKYKLYLYYFLPSRLLYFKNILQGNYPLNTSINDFQFQRLDENDLYAMMGNSKSMIDICHPKQESLSMRVLEAMGSDMKLITDYKGIVDYDFYNKNNILIIDSDNPCIPKDFLNLSYVALPVDIESKYTIDAWIDDVFFNKKSFESFSNKNDNQKKNYTDKY